jgi:hypothetical protein
LKSDPYRPPCEAHNNAEDKAYLYDVGGEDSQSDERQATEGASEETGAYCHL